MVKKLTDTEILKSLSADPAPQSPISAKSSNLQALLKAKDQLKQLQELNRIKAAADKPTLITDPDAAALARRQATIEAYKANPNRAIESAGVFEDALKAQDPNFQTIGDPYGPSKSNIKPKGKAYHTEASVPQVISKSGELIPTQITKNTSTPKGISGKMGGILSLAATAMPMLLDQQSIKDQILGAHAAQTESGDKLLQDIHESKLPKGKMPSQEDLAPFMQPTDMAAYFGNQEEAPIQDEQAEQSPEVTSNSAEEIQTSPKSLVDQHIQNAISQQQVQAEPQKDESLLAAQALKNKLQGSHTITKSFQNMLQSVAGVKPNTEIMDSLIKRSEEPVHNLKEQRDQAEVLAKLQTDQAKADPNSDVSKLYRESLRSLTQGLKINIPENMSAKQAEVIYPSLVAAANKRQADQERMVRQAEASQAKAEKDALLKQAKLDPQFQKFTEKLNEDLVSPRSSLGKEVMRRNQAIHALALLEGYKDLNKVPELQKRELAVALATMISPGLPHEETISKLDPQTVQQKISGYVTSLTGKPYAAGAGGIVDMLKDSVIRQQEVSEDRINKYHKTIEHSYSHLKNLDPERFENAKRAVLGEVEQNNKDPQIEKFAKDNRLSYDQAIKIIENRKNKMSK
jgi:hypothetical protein